MNVLQSIATIILALSVGVSVGFILNERLFSQVKRAFQTILEEERKYADEVVEENKRLREKCGEPENEEYRWS